MPVSIPRAIFQGIPECIAVAALVMSLGGEGFQWKTIFKIAISQVFSVYVFRSLVVTPGVHTILAMMTLAVFAFWWAKMELRIACQASAIAMAILVVIEMTIYFIINLLGIATFEEILSSDYLRTLITILLALLLFMLAITIDRAKQSRKMDSNIMS